MKPYRSFKRPRELPRKPTQASEAARLAVLRSHLRMVCADPTERPEKKRRLIADAHARGDLTAIEVAEFVREYLG